MIEILQDYNFLNIQTEFPFFLSMVWFFLLFSLGQQTNRSILWCTVSSRCSNEEWLHGCLVNGPTAAVETSIPRDVISWVTLGLLCPDHPFGLHFLTTRNYRWKWDCLIIHFFYIWFFTTENYILFSFSKLIFLMLFFFIREIFYGWCLRYLHSSGASFVFLFLFLHLGRAITYILQQSIFSWDFLC